MTNKKLADFKFENNNLKQKVKELNEKIKKDRHNKKIYKFYNWINEYKNTVIDLSIVIFFVLGIILSSIFAVYNISSEIFNYFASTLGKSHNDTLLLEVVEHFFLSVIPIFIFIGFYMYYLLKYQVIIIDNRDISLEKKKLANTSISITKTLFFSSILSYSVIKTISIVFNANDESSIKLISSGILLILLMIYLILSHKFNDD